MLDTKESRLEDRLPRRSGPRPLTTTLVPHQQLNQGPPAIIFQNLIERCQTLPETRQWESRLADRDTIALCVPESSAHGPAEAFIDDHEFCHIHPLPDGSLHLTLADGIRQKAISNGWAEPHLLTRTAALPPTLVMVYAPRNGEELDIVMELIAASASFARGV